MHPSLNDRYKSIICVMCDDTNDSNERPNEIKYSTILSIIVIAINIYRRIAGMTILSDISIVVFVDYLYSQLGGSMALNISKYII